MSALVPAYRHEAYVGAALDGIAAQTLRPFETVVVDDGSPDRTAEVVAAHGLSGLRLIRQENQGAHAALNRAMVESRGDWLAILDSDDVWEPTWIERALGAAAATGAGLVFGSVRWVDGEGRDLPADDERVEWYRTARETAAAAPDLATAIRAHNVAVTTSNFLVHRALWEAVGGFRPWRWVHDMDFLLRAIARVPDRVRFLESVPAVRYRVHGANTISEDTAKALDERARMLEALDREGVGRRSKGIGSALRRWVAGKGRPGEAVEARIDGWLPRMAGGEAAASREPFRVGLLTPALEAGGLEEAFCLLAQGLRAAGAEVSVRTVRAGAVAERLRRLGVPVSLAPGPDDVGLEEWLRETRPEVVSTHYVPVETVERIAATGVPVVETLHNVFAWYRDEEWAGEVRRMRACSGAIAVSAEVARSWLRGVERAGGDAEGFHLHIVPNAVQPERLAVPPRDLARSRLALPTEARVLMAMGRISVQKDTASIVSAFLEAAAEHPDAILLLAGSDAGDGTLERIEARHADALREGRVRRVGSVAPAVALAAADGFVMHSLFEGWSLAASEALWAGVPAVLGEMGGVDLMAEWAGESLRRVPHPLGDPTRVGPDDLDPGRTERVDLGRLEEGIAALLKGEVPKPPLDVLMRLRRQLDAGRMARKTLAVLRQVARETSRGG